MNKGIKHCENPEFNTVNMYASEGKQLCYGLVIEHCSPHPEAGGWFFLNKDTFEPPRGKINNVVSKQV